MTVTEFKAYACTGVGAPLKPWSYKPRPLGEHDVEIAIQFVGICHSDIHTLDSGWGPTEYPVVVGHEITGTVRALGSAVTRFKAGDRVGVGAQCWACLSEECPSCSSKLDQLCPKSVLTYNSHYEDGKTAYGGYAEAVRVNENYTFSIPDALPLDSAAPLLCGGTTVFSPMRRFDVKSGHNVGVIGIGGLGHLAVQFANKLGTSVTAISHSDNKRSVCKELGASHFLNISNEDDLKSKIGTLDFIIVTTSHDGQPWKKYFSLLKPRGQMILIGLAEKPIDLPASAVIFGEKSLTGSLIGGRLVVEDMLQFASKHKILPYIERFPIADVNRALDHVRSGKVRYRVVMETKF